MQETTSHDVDQLATFNSRFTRQGLLIRYARGRVSHFAGRQVLTIVGGLALGAAAGPGVGLSSMLLALAGEAVDCLCLRNLPNRLAAGLPMERQAAISSATAGFQALTIAICIWLGWFMPGPEISPLFAVAMLAGASINAGLVMPFHAGAARARLLVYALTPVVCFASEGLVFGQIRAGFWLNVIGCVLLGYMVFLFLKFVSAGFVSNRDNTRTLIERGRELAAANVALEQRQREAQRLSLVARNANDSVFLCTPDSRIVWVNEAFTRTTGYTPAEAIGHTPSDLLDSPDTSFETLSAMKCALKAGAPFRGEIQNITKDGREIWIETNQVPVVDDKGRVELMIAIERDITAAKEAARELATAKRRAEDGARAKAEFLATMSHEIRTPMNGVIGMADLLCDTSLSEEQRLYADTIRGSAQALLTIINDVLDLSKLDSGRMELSPIDFDLRACLSDTIRLLSPQATDKGLKLTLDLAPDLPATVHGDDGRLRQILINLIGNALKFTRKGGITVRARTQARGEDHALTFEVEDTGIGIPAQRIDQIFERFLQAEATIARRFGGTGLGLTITKKLVDAMDGGIAVQSVEGEGSTFTVTIGVGAAHGVGASDIGRLHAAAPGKGQAAQDLTGMRILVAEDNKVNRLLIAKFLADLPVALEFAEDGRQAIEKTAAFLPEVILMDMSMPVMDGLDATRVIRASAISQPVIIALTANAFESDRKSCLAAGMDGFLAKPVRRAELLDMIGNFRTDMARQAPTRQAPR